MLLQNTSDEKAKNDLSQIFGEYYQQFPEKYSQKFDGFIEQNNKFKNKQNNSNSKDDEQSENLPKISLPNIQKKDIEKFTVSFPSMVQQLRYVNVLDAVSEQLDAEKSILVLYHKQKEHLLSEMFI